MTPDRLRRTMAEFLTGVTVVTTTGLTVPHAMTANAVTSVSLSPPLVLVCVAHRASFHTAVIASGVWAVSMLSAEQSAVARHFATSGRDLITQFDQVPTFLGATGAPVLSEANAWLEARTQQVHEAGDHSIVVGEVVATGVKSVTSGPLAYHRGSYAAPEGTES
ncbi:MAG: flavin reductase family protein [Propionibacteriales bacterium]|nr:flavin reductase family protein [Propionibacteriales bacterium]